MTDLGDIFYDLGMEVDYILRDKITLCQNTYLKKIFDYFKMTNYKPTSLYMNLRIANSLQPFDRIADIMIKIIKWY